MAPVAADAAVIAERQRAQASRPAAPCGRRREGAPPAQLSNPPGGGADGKGGSAGTLCRRERRSVEAVELGDRAGRRGLHGRSIASDSRGVGGHACRRTSGACAAKVATDRRVTNPLAPATRSARGGPRGGA